MGEPRQTRRDDEESKSQIMVGVPEIICGIIRATTFSAKDGWEKRCFDDVRRGR